MRAQIPGGLSGSDPTADSAVNGMHMHCVMCGVARASGVTAAVKVSEGLYVWIGSASAPSACVVFAAVPIAMMRLC